MLENKEIKRPYLNYEGPFNIQIISGFAKFLSELTIASLSVRKKLYRVFIELTQNVALYAVDRAPLLNSTTIGMGRVYVTDQNDSFKCITINRIQKEHIDILLKNCNEINATPIDVLRVKKRELYRLASIHDTGAHIGLIMIFIYSENPLKFEVLQEENDLVYFKIEATINKVVVSEPN